MLQPRIIPCLLIHNKGLVKTTQFKISKYIGDPLNAVKIFNEKEVDELIVLDIDASRANKEPNYKMIENLASECRMPLCYGGGIKSLEQAQLVFSLGVEKIALSSIAIENSSIIPKLVERVGNQSIVVVLDVRKVLSHDKYEIFLYNGIKPTRLDPISFAIELQKMGVGELAINSIDNDGQMQGFDLNLIDKIRNAINIPLTVIGGAGSLFDIGHIIKQYGIIGVGVGSLFVFKGKYKAVLINYPTPNEKSALINEYFLNYHIKTVVS